LLAGLILHVITAPNHGHRNLVTVRELVYRGHVRKALLQNGQQSDASGFDLLWPHGRTRRSMVMLQVGKNLGSSVARSSGPEGCGTLRDQFINNHDMRASLEASDFDLASLKTDPKGMTRIQFLQGHRKISAVADPRNRSILIASILGKNETLSRLQKQIVL
jgi:hypothetical protein